MIALTTRSKIGLASVLLITSFAFGRWSTPEKVRIETKTVEVEKKTETTDTDRDKHQETTTVEVKKPDGTVETTTKTVLDSRTDQQTKEVQTDSKSTDQVKEVTRGSSPVTVSVLGGIQLGGPPTPLYGAAITRPVLGPIAIGLFGLSNRVCGASVGLTF